MNLLEQQAANRRRTLVVMAAFVAFLAFLGAGFDVFVLGAGQVYVPVGTVAALAIGLVSSWITLRNGDRMVLGSASAVPLEEWAAGVETDQDRLLARQFDNVVEEMAIAAGIPKPAVYVIPDEDPNAFATGRDPAHASLAATAGLLRALNREQLQGVVAHEMSHIRNFDIRLMMIVAALAGGIVLLADWSGRIMRFGGMGRGRSSRKSGGKGGSVLLVVFLVIWVISIILAPLIARLLALWVSRTREYQADATGAELTRNPLGLASALAAIEGADAPTAAIKRGSALLCIADPVGRAVNEKEGRVASLLATHPPMAKRIQALKEMAYQSGALPSA